jgi:peptidoglycan/LPS O-acetylase OafA/YrhL
MKREIELDVVRGVAILLAVGWHFNKPTGTILDVALAPGYFVGWAGVDLFFVLSGFLVGRLVLTELAQTGSFDYRQFFVRRALRLWPVLYLYIAAQLLIGDDPWTSYAPQVLLHVQNFFRTPLNHLWSLAVEEHFYLALGLIAPLLARRDGGPKAAALALVAICAGALALRCLGFVNGVDRIAIQWQTQYRLDALAFGVLLAVTAVHFPTTLDRLLKPRIWWATIAIVGFTTLAATRDINAFRSTVGYTLAYLSSGALLLAIYRAPLPRLSGLVTRPLAFLGVSSYSLYIWHTGVGRLGSELLHKVTGIDNLAVLTLAKYAVAIPFAYVVTRAVERPGIVLRDRLIPRRGGGEAGLNEPGLQVSSSWSGRP